MAVVKNDAHGVYVKAGGYVFRPIHPLGYNHTYKDGTVFVEGDKVAARHCGGTPLGTVSKGGVKETWHSHGNYIGDGPDKSSDECFKPSYDTWPAANATGPGQGDVWSSHGTPHIIPTKQGPYET